MQIREYAEGDWPAVWPIFREVVDAGDTYPYDPETLTEQVGRFTAGLPTTSVNVRADADAARVPPNLFGRPSSPHRATEGCTTLKVTIDSNDPLPDALRVLGAMYNVTVVVESTTSTPSGNDKRLTDGKASSRRTAKNATRRGRARDAKHPAPARGARRSAGNGTAPGAPDLRSWARRQGYQVGDRGRMPAAVVAAYREAHPG